MPKPEVLSPERRLILIAAGTKARRVAREPEAQHLATEADWNAITTELRGLRMLPTVGPRLLAIAGHEAPSSFADEVEEALALGRRHSAFLEMVGELALSTLADRDIRAAPLKGPQLGRRLYGDAGRRSSTDIDILVTPKDLGRAVAAIRALGYGEPHDQTNRAGLPLLHFSLTHELGELPPVELHWRVHWYEEAFSTVALLPPDVAAEGWRPQPVDELCALLLFYARDGLLGIKMASDIGAWWERFGDELRAGDLDRVVKAHPRLARPLTVAASAAAETVGTPRSPASFEGVPIRLRERVASRLADPFPDRDRDQILAEMGLMDALLAPPGDAGRRFLRRQILMPAESVGRETPVGEVEAERPSLDLLRRVVARCGIFARYGLALLRVPGRG